MRHFVVVALAVVVTLALCGVVAAQQTVIVSVTDTGLNKAEISIDTGDTVVWANSSARYVTIFFSGGKEVELACAAPTRFHMADDGTYSSGVIPPGAVASLCFAEPGAFQYSVAGTGQAALLKGAVTAK